MIETHLNNGFLISKDDPVLTKFNIAIAAIEDSDERGLRMDLLPKGINEKDTGFILSFIGAAQHHPAVLKRLLLGISFNFLNDDKTDMAPKMIEQWLESASFHIWLNHVYNHIPLFIFFINDREMRHYCLIGYRKESYKKNNKSLLINSPSLMIPPTIKEEITAKFNLAATAFTAYCRRADIYPKQYIDTVFEENIASRR